MDHPLRLDRVELAVRPWRTATVLIAAVAAIELVLLIVIGGALLAKPDPVGRRATAKAPAVTAKKHVATGGARRAGGAPATEGARGRAQRQRPAGCRGGRGIARLGPRLPPGAVGNAPRQDYPQSIVMYRRGFEGEGRRLARDLGVKVVGPLDGMRPGQLHGAHAVFILGS